MSAQPIVAIVGPTAVGKSDLAIELALAIGGEVLNCDSMQLYRGMDIGTAKVPPNRRRGVAHHLLDVLEVRQPATVMEFQSLARAAIQECRRRHVVPVLVGGSALYVRAVLDVFDFPGTDPRLRAELERELDTVGSTQLHARLASLDPASGGAILPGNGRRIVRALEVIAMTGRPFTARLPAYAWAYERVVQIGLDVDRQILDSRIASRVDAMWRAGFVDEVRGLVRQGLRDAPTASKALGYRQVMEHLDGRIEEAEAREQTVLMTRRFARRQFTWFRRDPRTTWLPFDDPELLGHALAVVG